MSLPLRLGLLGLLCAASSAAAVEVQVKNAWVRSAVLGQAMTPAYVDLRSDIPLTLVGADSPWAGRIEIRAAEFKDGVLAERAVPKLQVPAGAEVRLAPGGSYLALTDVRHAFGNGDSVPITLRFEDAAHIAHTVDLKAQARGLMLSKPSAGTAK